MASCAYVNIHMCEFRRVEDLEKANIINLEKFKAKTKELKQSVQKDLEDAVLDATGNDLILNIGENK